MSPIATDAKASQTPARQQAIHKLPPDTGATPMHLKAIIAHAVVRSIHKAGNRQGESRVIEDAAIERIADSIASEVMDVIAMYRHNTGGET
jgi:hypothetical protein